MLKKTFLLLLFIVGAMVCRAESIKVSGVVKDKSSKEPLVGAMVVNESSGAGSITDDKGEFELNLSVGKHKLSISYLSYKTLVIDVEVTATMGVLSIELEADDMEMDEVLVVGKKNLDNEVALIRERGLSSVSIENLGVKEMSMKGISNVQEGVKKMTGISVASAGQIIVRGLGDRYSITTLNGLPIASLNPDNKLIPLDIFPSATVKNVTVSKVYDVTSFADYSGAHIDIGTKEQGSEKHFSFGISAGGMLNTVGRDFYTMDNVSMFSMSKLHPDATSGDYLAFNNLVKSTDIFDTNFDVTKSTALPDLSGNIAYGNSYNIGAQRLDVLATASISSGNETILGMEERKLNDLGVATDEYFSDEFKSEVEIAALGSVGMTLRDNDYIGYNIFYARNASNTYMERRGHDFEYDNLLGINNVSHIYSMLNQQLTGKHRFGTKLSLNWAASYGITSSDEPDRRAVLYTEHPTETRFFVTNDPTQRFFGSLDENEVDALVDVAYMLKGESKIKIGFAFKDKMREYRSKHFLYNLFPIRNSVITDYYTPSEFINSGSISDGTITIDRMMKNRNQYDAKATVLAGFIAADLNVTDNMLVNIGVRVEDSRTTVDYHDFNDVKQVKELNTFDFFPAMNIKYNLTNENLLRLSASRTVTRPSFIEMTPFEYQESYGSAKIIGYADLENGYNYNFDLRYEALSNDGDMLSLSGYYKLLKNPIERVQTIQGEDGVVHTFRNAEEGSAMGVEVEFRKKFFNALTLSLNGSYMYTDVSLSDSGSTVYTNKSRALQGASPYLFNADITYGLKFHNDNELHFAMLYNLQGPRIHSVGLNNFGDVMQHAVHYLNFVATYKVNKKYDIKFELNNLANQEFVFDQELPGGGEPIVVEKYRPGIGASIGISFKF